MKASNILLVEDEATLRSIIARNLTARGHTVAEADSAREALSRLSETRSDLMLLDAALIPHGRTVLEKTIMAASLDHALWFHRPFRADEWLLYAQDSPSSHGARGFCRGSIFTRDGVLVASVAFDNSALVA